ncbi:RagB/SusD family nutrient uptake outer membrane protein [Xanthocytophaga agilis]|uniref:RagB/SusD family nutrient uptake outer membrane protein n=1 Tax=Xanthocytophaga agilis TaxID=3048010 RepID=A0AAE3R5D8_9BACT|nr:RagB/SusD family nutrient uptake outer membrane protein [Xanthocytophaga agilis]MDJ1501007.1 RagB/SusD family nutrient uptake outer membrane protein [Xanthocytophaga agilis]
MNNIVKNITLLTSLLIATSCSNMLDVNPQGAPTSGSFWKTEADAIAGVNAVYDLYSDDDMYGRGFFWLNNASDDIGTKPRANAEKIKNFLVDGSESDTKSIWAKHYQVMKRSNDVIRNVPNITMTNEALKNRILGEAYFNHAVMHLELAYRYGDDRAGIPIQDRENPENIYVTRTKNVGENYAYIVADLAKAAELLPYFSEYVPADYGRAHKTAAWAYMARTYLYAKDWANAEKYADMVINSGKHGLLTEFEDVFKIANNWSKEYIWSVSSSASNTSKGCIFPGVLLEDKGWGLYNGWGNFYPTKELFDTYQEGDERLPATILKTGDKFMFFGEERTYNVGSFTVGSSNRTGYQFKKYMEPFGYANPVGTYVNPNGDKPSTTLNVPLLRYADVILMKAEARLMQNKDADTEINMIRERAGLTPLSGATMTDLKRERRCEFAGEWTDRHWDLVRWGDAEATYAKPLHHADGHVIYEGRTFKPTVHHVWPIPPDEIAVSKGALWQNEGY